MSVREMEGKGETRSATPVSDACWLAESRDLGHSALRICARTLPQAWDGIYLAV